MGLHGRGDFIHAKAFILNAKHMIILTEDNRHRESVVFGDQTHDLLAVIVIRLVYILPVLPPVIPVLNSCNFTILCLTTGNQDRQATYGVMHIDAELRSWSVKLSFHYCDLMWISLCVPLALGGFNCVSPGSRLLTVDQPKLIFNKPLQGYNGDGLLLQRAAHV